MGTATATVNKSSTQLKQAKDKLDDLEHQAFLKSEELKELTKEQERVRAAGWLAGLKQLHADLDSDITGIQIGNFKFANAINSLVNELNRFLSPDN